MIKKPEAMGVAKPADRRSIFLIAAVAFFAVALIFYIFQPGGEPALKIYSDLAPIVVSGFAAAMALLLFSETKPQYPVRLVWLLLGLGLLCDFLGETIWAFSELILKIEVPYPSLADIGWVLAYPLFFLGLYRQLRLVRTGKRWQEWFSLVGGGVAGALILFFIILRPILLNGEIAWVEKSLDICYPLFSLLNFIVALWLIMSFGKGILEEGWLLICIAYFFFGIGDTAYAYLTSRGLYTGIGDIFSDLSWISGYLLLGLGFYFIRFRTE